MKKFIVLIASALFLLADADAINVELLANNKEALSRELSLKDVSKAQEWAQNHGDPGSLKSSLLSALSLSLKHTETEGQLCDIGLVQLFEKNLQEKNIIHASEDVSNVFNYLRLEGLIDDIFLDILRKSYRITMEFEKNLKAPVPMRPLNLNTRQNSGINLKKLYSPFQQWPNESKKCSLDIYWEMTSDLNFKSNKDRDQQIQKLNYMAVKDGVINLDLFNKLEVLRREKALDWPVYLRRYLDIISNLKDKLTNNPELSTNNTFTIEYVSRRQGLTARENLYQNYTSTQLMMLAQIIERTAKRMDARKASINWQFSQTPHENDEIYVLSPMEQYRAALKMLRKEMAEVMRSEVFRNKNLEYEHIIAAAFEAGFIKTEELNYVLRFEEFWNPSVPKWKAYMNFATSLAGTAVFYLPPPWNLVGAIGLVLTQTKVANGNKRPDADDNWNVII
jgi:hypothetical protein